MNKEMIEKILEAAVKAPSGDNVQPWRLQVSENFTWIDLYNRPEKDDSYYNFEQAASYIAHGAVLENILIASRHVGVDARYTLFPDSAQPDLVARIELTSGAPRVDDPLYPAIFKRRTNRFPYRHVDVSERAMKELADSVDHIDAVRVDLVKQQDQIKRLAKILKINDRLVFERKDIHGFLFDKIRWNKKQVEESRDGMPVGTLGLNPMEKLFFPLLRFWGMVKTANVFGLSKIIELKCWWNCRNATILGMISATGDDNATFVQGGRAMQRLWLEATRQELELQPIIGLTLLIRRYDRNALHEFSDKHRQMVERAAASLRGELGLDKTDTLIMGFRLGKGTPPAATTERRTVDS